MADANVSKNSATASDVDLFRGLDKSSLTKLVWFLSIIGALGGFLFGYDTAIIGTAIVFAGPLFHMTNAQIGLSVASVTLGAALGAGLAGYYTDRLGRKFFLIIDAALFGVFAFLLALSINTFTFFVWRFLLGIGIGGDSVISVVYIAEFAPIHKRGTLLYLQQVMIVVGIFIAFWIGYALTPSGNWRLMIGLGVIPAILILALRSYLPDSPRWLLSKGRNTDLKKSLVRMGLSLSDEEINRNLDIARKTKEGKWSDLFKTSMIGLTTIAILIGVLSQFTGINVFIYYSPTIFAHLGYSATSAAFTTGWLVGLGILWPMFITGFFMIDKLGRRRSFMASYLGLSVMLFLAVFFLKFTTGIILGVGLLIGIFIYLFMFEVAAGPGTWTMGPEMFPTSLRGRGTAVLSIAVWLGDFFVSATFPIFLASIGLIGTFLIYGIVSLAAFILWILVLPETSHRTLEVISKELVGREV